MDREILHLPCKLDIGTRPRWLIILNSDGPQFFYTSKKIVKYSKGIKTTRSRTFWFISGYLTSLQTWIASRYVTEIRDCFIPWLRKWFISNQSKMLYYWGGSFLVCQHERRGGVWLLYEALGLLNSSVYTITHIRFFCVVIMKIVWSSFSFSLPSTFFITHSYCINFHTHKPKSCEFLRLLICLTF